MSNASSEYNTSGGTSAGETKVIYHVDDEETPYLIKIPVPGNAVTLGVLKTALNKVNCKFFIKTMDDELGMVVKEEVLNDNALLPLSSGRIVVYINQIEGSHVGSDSASQYTESAVTENWPPTRNDRGGQMWGVEDEYSMTENESVAPPPHQRSRDRQLPARYIPDRGYESSTTAVTATDYESQSFMESTDDESCLRGLPGHLGAPRNNAYGDYRHRRPRRVRKRPPQYNRRVPGKAPSASSVTDSTMSLNIITVNINMDATKFLGISIVGQSTNDKGDGGIYVGEIMKGGAVHQEGQIEPGDLILQVNDISFDNMSNDAAVRVLREIVNKPGALKLVVAKYWNPHPANTGSYFALPKNEPLHPIDPATWVEASRIHTMNGSALSPVSVASDGSTVSLSDSNNVCYYPTTSASVAQGDPGDGSSTGEYKTLSHSGTDPITILRTMQLPNSGLEIKDRMWLKITIPNAFLGMNLVDWIFEHVDGFSDRREARTFAKKLLKDGYLKHTTGKSTFSEQCYYVFNNEKVNGSSMGTLNVLHSNHDHGPFHDHLDEEEQDVLSPLPYASPWNAAPQYTGYIPPQMYNIPGQQLDCFGPPSSISSYSPVSNQQTMQTMTSSLSSRMSMPLPPQTGSGGMNIGGRDFNEHDRNMACNSPGMQQRKEFANPFRANGESVFANVM